MRCGFGQVMDTAFYLFLSSPLLTFMQLFLLAPFNLSIHLSVSASPLPFSLSLPLFLYQSAPLRVIYGFISSRSFCQNKITICAIEQKLDGFDPKRKKKERKERTRKYLLFSSSFFPQNLKINTNREV